VASILPNQVLEPVCCEALGLVSLLVLLALATSDGCSDVCLLVVVLEELAFEPCEPPPVVAEPGEEQSDGLRASAL
jgi:hypothetical protein